MTRSALFLAVIGAGSLFAESVIDRSPTRVQTTLDPGLRPIGTLKPKGAGEISTSHWSLDCAGMDREHADFLSFADYLPPLGIKRLRVQAGWARCEKDPGIFDFAWLDQIVFGAAKRGLEVWLETSYGNPAYKDGGGRQLAGGMPKSPEAVAAWDRWVLAMANRYKGFVHDWCVWNEPDHPRANNTKEYFTDMSIRTAELIRSVDPAARIGGCCVMMASSPIVDYFCETLAARRKTDLFNWICYHHYTMNPDDGYDEVDRMRATVARNLPHARLWSNEGGTQSEWVGAGAMARYPWTELTQAKWDLRRYIADLGRGEDTSVFHAIDLEYRTSGFHDGLLRYGLIKTCGQADGFRVEKVKMSYYAVQNAVSVFNDALVPSPEIKVDVSGGGRTSVYAFRNARMGTPVIAFWDASGIPGNENKTKLIELAVADAGMRNPVWVDLVSGRVYGIAPNDVRVSDGKSVYSVPCYDSVALVTSRDLLDIEEDWYVRWARENVPSFDVKQVVKGRFSVGDRRLLAEAMHTGFFDLRLAAGDRFPEPNGRDADIEGVLTFRIKAPRDMVTRLFERTDWYWGVTLNGDVLTVDRFGRKQGAGELDRWSGCALKLKAGWNEVAFWTRPGCSGKWQTSLCVADPSNELELAY